MKRKNKIIIYVVISLFFFIVGGFLTYKKIEKSRDDKRASIVYSNQSYRDVLEIKGNHKVDHKGVHYDGEMKIDTEVIYRKIAFINVFITDVNYEYSDVDKMIDEYKQFCETGEDSEYLWDFYDNYFAAIDRAKPLTADDVYYAIRKICSGELYVSEGKVVQDDSSKNEHKFENYVDACKYYEANYSVINSWLEETHQDDITTSSTVAISEDMEDGYFAPTNENEDFLRAYELVSGTWISEENNEILKFYKNDTDGLYYILMTRYDMELNREVTAFPNYNMYKICIIEDVDNSGEVKVEIQCNDGLMQMEDCFYVEKNGEYIKYYDHTKDRKEKVFYPYENDEIPAEEYIYMNEK